MNAKDLSGIVASISKVMDENRNLLIKLDSQNGDGDLGISMNNGFLTIKEFLAKSNESDLGRLFNKTADVFNEAAPSSLGTILSFLMKGMARSLKGKEEVSLSEAADALLAGINNIMQRAQSKPGEKTILDSLYPGAAALKKHAKDGARKSIEKALQAAKDGAENTKKMKAVWGRAAYYGDQSIGILDGGAVAGSLIFEGLYLFVR